MSSSSAPRRAQIEVCVHKPWRWRSNPSGECSQERLTLGTVTSTRRRAAHPSGRAKRGAGTGCSAMKHQSLLRPSTETTRLINLEWINIGSTVGSTVGTRGVHTDKLTGFRPLKYFPKRPFLRGAQGPLSRLYQTVKARFWPWREPFFRRFRSQVSRSSQTTQRNFVRL